MIFFGILIKNLSKQLDTLLVKSILNDKTKNKIKDEEINGIKTRFQNFGYGFLEIDRFGEKFQFEKINTD